MSSLGDLPAPGLPDFTLSILARNPTPLYINAIVNMNKNSTVFLCVFYLKKIKKFFVLGVDNQQKGAIITT